MYKILLEPIWQGSFSWMKCVLTEQMMWSKVAYRMSHSSGLIPVFLCYFSGLSFPSSPRTPNVFIPPISVHGNAVIDLKTLSCQSNRWQCTSDRNVAKRSVTLTTSLCVSSRYLEIGSQYCDAKSIIKFRPFQWDEAPFLDIYIFINRIKLERPSRAAVFDWFNSIELFVSQVKACFILTMYY